MATVVDGRVGAQCALDNEVTARIYTARVLQTRSCRPVRLASGPLQTVMVAPLTSNLKRGQAVGNVTLSAGETCLDRTSVVLVCQVMALDRCFFDELVSTLSTSPRRRVDAGLRLALGLG